MVDPRVLIIGIDGFDLNLVDNLLPPSALPTIHTLRKTGVICELESVFPTHSASAWASFMTGQNPAKHGVFDFKVRLPDGRYQHAKPDLTQTLWHILGQNGYRVGVYNFPVTFPPDPVNGWMVSGMLSPDLERATFPSSLGKEMIKEFPGYKIDVEWVLYRNRPQELLEDLTSLVQQRQEVVRYLLKREPVDIFAMAFTATDRAQHAIWRYLDNNHPLYDPEEAENLKSAIHDFYYNIDAAIADLITLAGPDTLIFILSDHGFQSATWQFNTTEWLAENGWLVYKSGVKRIKHFLRRWDTPRIRKIRRRIFTDISRHVKSLSRDGDINWEETVAYNPWNYNQGIRINVKGREPNGIVSHGKDYEAIIETIFSRLSALRHPETGAPVISKSFRSHEMFAGEYVDLMPDVIFDLHPNFSPGIHQTRLFERTGWLSGAHSLSGFLLFHSHRKIPLTLNKARLIDIAPTILKIMGVNPPNTMDGCALGVLIADGGKSIPLVNKPKPKADPRTDYGDLTPEEEANLMEQLRNLGYL